MNKVNLYDEQIRELYLEKRMAMNKIAAQLNISVGKVYNCSWKVEKRYKIK